MCRKKGCILKIMGRAEGDMCERGPEKGGTSANIAGEDGWGEWLGLRDSTTAGQRKTDLNSASGARLRRVPAPGI